MQKEINETIYWLELLKASNFLTNEQFEGINSDGVEIIKLNTSIIMSTKSNILNKHYTNYNQPLIINN